MNVTQVEGFWDGLSVRQRALLLQRIGAEGSGLEMRKWYQLSQWVRKGLMRLPAYKLVVPMERARVQG